MLDRLTVLRNFLVLKEGISEDLVTRGGFEIRTLSSVNLSPNSWLGH